MRYAGGFHMAHLLPMSPELAHRAPQSYVFSSLFPQILPCITSHNAHKFPRWRHVSCSSLPMSLAERLAWLPEIRSQLRQPAPAALIWPLGITGPQRATGQTHPLTPWQLCLNQSFISADGRLVSTMGTQFARPNKIALNGFAMSRPHMSVFTWDGRLPPRTHSITANPLG